MKEISERISEEISALCEELLGDFAAEGAELSDDADKVELLRDYIDAGCEPVEAFFRLVASYEDHDDALLAELRKTPAEVAEQRRSCKK